jgi:hypothetical protein
MRRSRVSRKRHKPHTRRFDDIDEDLMPILIGQSSDAKS